MGRCRHWSHYFIFTCLFRHFSFSGSYDSCPCRLTYGNLSLIISRNCFFGLLFFLCKRNTLAVWFKILCDLKRSRYTYQRFLRSLDIFSPFIVTSMYCQDGIKSFLFISGTDLRWSHRYSSCSSYSFLLRWPLQKPNAISFSNWIGMKFDRNVVQVPVSGRPKYASIDGFGFSIWRHTFKVATVTSFNAEKCCHLVSEHEASAGTCAATFRQFLIYSTFLLVSDSIPLGLPVSSPLFGSTSLLPNTSTPYICRPNHTVQTTLIYRC